MDDVRAAMGPAAARFYGDPDLPARRGRHHRHERQDDDRLPRPPPARGRRAPRPGCSARSSGSWAGWRRRSSAPRPRRSTCRRPSARMLDAGDTRPARWRSPRTRSSSAASAGIRFALPRVHQPHPGPPRLPRDDGGVLRGQAAPVRRARPRGREHRRRATAAGSPPRSTPSPSAIESGDADYRARDDRLRLRRARTSCSTRPDGTIEVSLAAARPVQRAERDWARSPRCARSGSRTISLAGFEPRAGPLRAGGRGPGLRRARGLRAHARLARERAARRARAHPGPAARGVRRRRRPRPPRSAR